MKLMGRASDMRGARIRRVTWQFARFLAVGGVSFALDYGLYVLLLHQFGVQYLVASTISFSVSLVLNYILTLKFVFEARPGRSLLLEFLVYIGLNIIALGLNQLILFLAVDALGVPPLVGKLIATAVVLVYNFISRKVLIERMGGRAPSSRGETTNTPGTGGTTS